MLSDLNENWQESSFWKSGETDTAGFSICHQGAELLITKDVKMGVLVVIGDFKAI